MWMDSRDVENPRVGEECVLGNEWKAIQNSEEIFMAGEQGLWGGRYR